MEDDSSVGPPLTRSEALYRIRETLSSMAQDLSDVDRYVSAHDCLTVVSHCATRSSDKAVFDARSNASLEERCRTAQVARSKISKSLQMAQMAEVELRSKYAPIKDRAERNALLVSCLSERGYRNILLIVDDVAVERCISSPCLATGSRVHSHPTHPLGGHVPVCHIY